MTSTHHDIDTSSNGHSSSNSDGSAAKEVHIDPKRYKTKMCRRHMNEGSCPYETRCMFAHGPLELRTPDENTRDGLVTESAIKRHQQQLMYLERTSAIAAAAAAAAVAQQQQQQQPVPPTQAAAAVPAVVESKQVAQKYAYDPYSSTYTPQYIYENNNATAQTAAAAATTAPTVQCTCPECCPAAQAMMYPPAPMPLQPVPMSTCYPAAVAPYYTNMMPMVFAP